MGLDVITPALLATVRVLWRQPDLMTLWGLPYEMRVGQSPYDLWKSTTTEDTVRSASGWHGARLPAPGPRPGWLWLGQPGWWGHLTPEERAAIEDFLAPLRAADLIPSGPCEWTALPERTTP